MPRWGFAGMAALLLATCGIGVLYLQYVQFSALKKLNPKAHDPLVGSLLSILGLLLSLGLGSLFVTYQQTVRLTEYADLAADPRRNHALLTNVMGGSVVGLLSSWLGWTGVMLVLALGASVYAMRAFHAELELYTDP